MTWILTIMLGCSGWGCGAYQVGEYPNEQSCYKALKEMHLEANTKLASGESGSFSGAYCKPAGIKK